MPPDEFDRLVQIMHRLRRDCPWDRSQDRASLRPYLLEEAYEVLEAIDRGDSARLREELGDLMLQVVFHAELAREAGEFDIRDVLRTINDKLVRRHPHVFGDERADGPQEVMERWEQIKTGQEKKPSFLDGVPADMPALARAARVLLKMRRSGADPLPTEDALRTAREKLEDLEQAAAAGDASAAESAVGALLLCVVDAAGGLGVSAEDALRGTVRQLADAFREQERRLKAEGRSLAELTRDEARGLGERVAAKWREMGR